MTQSLNSAPLDLSPNVIEIYSWLLSSGPQAHKRVRLFGRVKWMLGPDNRVGPSSHSSPNDNKHAYYKQISKPVINITNASNISSADNLPSHLGEIN